METQPTAPQDIVKIPNLVPTDQEDNAMLGFLEPSVPEPVSVGTDNLTLCLSQPRRPSIIHGHAVLDRFGLTMPMTIFETLDLCLSLSVWGQYRFVQQYLFMSMIRPFLFFWTKNEMSRYVISGCH